MNHCCPYAAAVARAERLAVQLDGEADRVTNARADAVFPAYGREAEAAARLRREVERRAALVARMEAAYSEADRAPRCGGNHRWIEWA